MTKPRNKKLRLALRVGLYGLAASLGVVYGFFVHRDQIFPYRVGQAVMRLVAAPSSDGDGLPGFWVNAPSSNPPGDQAKELEKLSTLGYLAGYEQGPAGMGVVVHDREQAWPGVNLYVSAHSPEALLVDMDGEVLHWWRLRYEKAFPDHPVNPKLEGQNYWRAVHLYPNGDLLAIFNSYGIVRINKDSELIWAVKSNAHHAVDVAEDGKIFALTFDTYVPKDKKDSRAIREDFVDILSPAGELIKRFSLQAAIKKSKYEALLTLAPKRGDILHMNALKILDGRYEAKLPQFRKQNLLVSSRFIDTVAVVDPEKEEVVWALAGMSDGQHDPSLVEGGNLLLFDNRIKERGSRAVEMDPLTHEVLWEFPPQGSSALFSKCCGMSQRLENGNTLITYTGMGRALEVTREGRIVWQFDSPHRAGDDGELVAALQDVRRLPVELVSGWLEKKPATEGR